MGCRQLPGMWYRRLRLRDTLLLRRLNTISLRSLSCRRVLRFLQQGLLLVSFLFFITTTLSAHEGLQAGGKKISGKEEKPEKQAANKALAAPAIEQFTVRDVIRPKSAEVSLREVFHIHDSELRSGNPVAEDSGEVFPDSSEIFGDRPAYIPFWQLSDLLKNRYSTRFYGREGRKERALVGGGAIYLPPELGRVEQEVARLVLEDLTRNRKVYQESLRVELNFLSLPEQLIEPHLNDGLNVEQISRKKSSVRYALHNSRGETVAVIKAEIRNFIPGFSAVVPMDAGERLEMSSLRRTAVPLERDTGFNGTGERKKGLSEAALASGYRYTLNKDVEAGEIIGAGAWEVRAPVERGDELSCVFERGNISLRMSGKALSRGGNGELVKVRLATGEIRKMRVESRGTVSSFEEGTEG